MYKKIKDFLRNYLKEEKVELKPSHYDSISFRVDDKKIDDNGHVNFKFLCEFFENGFREYMQQRRVSHEFLGKEFGKTTFFRRQEIDYLGELKLYDAGIILTGVSEIHNSSFVVYQIIQNNKGKTLVVNKVIVVLFDIETKQKSIIPEVIRDRILSK